MKTIRPEPVLKHRFKVGDSFEQEVHVSRRSVFRILGTDLTTAAEYAFVSRLTIDSIARDGGLTARQVIEEARLINCDPGSKEALEDALRKAQKKTFSMTVRSSGEVAELKGPKDPIRIVGGAGAEGGQSFRVWSLLDEDAWKELNSLTFFHATPPPRPGQTWTRGLAHSWGPLGDWSGRSTFIAKGLKEGTERIEYAHALTYRPPAVGAGGGLPFKVLHAEFQPPLAGGVLLYNTSRERVSAAEETFRVQGTLAVSLAGTDVVVELDEAQAFRLRIREPSEPVLTGRPPPLKR